MGHQAHCVTHDHIHNSKHDTTGTSYKREGWRGTSMMVRCIDIRLKEWAAEEILLLSIVGLKQPSSPLTPKTSLPLPHSNRNCPTITYVRRPYRYDAGHPS